MALYIVVSPQKVYVDYGAGRVLAFNTGEVFDADPSLPSVNQLLRAYPAVIQAYTAPQEFPNLVYESLNFSGGTSAPGDVTDEAVNWIGSTNLTEVRIAAPCTLRLVSAYVFPEAGAFTTLAIKINKNGSTVATVPVAANGANPVAGRQMPNVAFAAGDLLTVLMDATGLPNGNVWTSAVVTLQY